MKNANPLLRKKILGVLDSMYPKVKCALHFESVFQLLVATILSAQCTDRRVNMVTPKLFAKFESAEQMASAKINDVEQLIYTTGFYRSKAKYIVGAAKMIVKEFGGEVPRSMDELLRLPGVARKTANVVLSVGYGILVGVVVDTHVTRISHRLGFTRARSPVHIEQDLMKIIPMKNWDRFSLQLIQLGRELCVARKPLCGECPLKKLCPSAIA